MVVDYKIHERAAEDGAKTASSIAIRSIARPLLCSCSARLGAACSCVLVVVISIHIVYACIHWQVYQRAVRISAASLWRPRRNVSGIDDYGSAGGVRRVYSVQTRHGML